MSDPDTTQSSTFLLPAQRHSRSLEGVSGRLRLDVGGRPVAVLEVRDGDLDRRLGGGDADAVAACDSEETIAAIARGALNPVVAVLQNRLELTGDRAFAIKVILGLHTVRAERTKP